MNGFWVAVGFLTTLPARAAAYEQDGLGKAAAWFPVVGLGIGLVLAAVEWAARPLVGGAVAALLVVAVWAALTGGLHLDGLADCGDGLLASTTPERRLEIMRDPRVGSFGVTVLVLALLLKVAGVYSLPAGGAGMAGLLLAPMWARWWILVAARRPKARPGGMGDAFGAALTNRRVAVAAVLPVVVTVVAVAGGEWRVLVGIICSCAAALGVVALAQRRIGGVTGDVLGAVVELSEIALLVGMARP